MQSSARILAYFIKKSVIFATCWSYVFTENRLKKSIQTPKDTVTEIWGRPEWLNTVFATMLSLPWHPFTQGAAGLRGFAQLFVGGRGTPKAKQKPQVTKAAPLYSICAPLFVSKAESRRSPEEEGGCYEIQWVAPFQSESTGVWLSITGTSNCSVYTYLSYLKRHK